MKRHSADDKYQLRKHPDLVKMVEALMAARRYRTYTELFTAAIREMWERASHLDK